MRYLILVVLEVCLVLLSLGKDLSNISSWLIGINFTSALFSVNFTLFGYQLSRYKPILDRPTYRQWINIILLMTLPFFPLITFLLAPKLHAHIALWLLPIVTWSSFDNAKLTITYLDPVDYIKRTFTDGGIRKYIEKLYHAVAKEVVAHKEYIKNRERFQIPSHEWSFSPDILGVTENDLWDKATVVAKQAFSNNDYPVFMKSLEGMMPLVQASYSVKSKSEGDYREIDGVASITHKRFRSLINWIAQEDKEGAYIEAFANRLCAYLRTPDAIANPLRPLTENIMSDVTYLGSVMLEAKQCSQPMKVLNTIHAVLELSVHQIEEDAANGKKRTLDQWNIAGYAHLIKSLGSVAILNGNDHFVYRCMETLSYLGCNAAKIGSKQTVVASFQCLVQLGRKSRKAGRGCFWSRCIIPLHKHAEEFMGHILTWLVRNLADDGSFTLKACAEQAYSRIRGIECEIRPQANANPKFWIHEREEGDPPSKVPHVETLCGMYGYDGQVDYSDFEDETEYTLMDFD